MFGVVLERGPMLLTSSVTFSLISSCELMKTDWTWSLARIPFYELLGLKKTCL